MIYYDIYDMIYMIYLLHKNSSFSEIFVLKNIVTDVITPQIWSFPAIRSFLRKAQGNV